jgi:hypothetical protein
MWQRSKQTIEVLGKLKRTKIRLRLTYIVDLGGAMSDQSRFNNNGKATTDLLQSHVCYTLYRPDPAGMEVRQTSLGLHFLLLIEK